MYIYFQNQLLISSQLIYKEAAKKKKKTLKQQRHIEEIFFTGCKGDASDEKFVNMTIFPFQSH